MEADNHEATEHDIVEEIDTEHEIRIANHFNTTANFFWSRDSGDKYKTAIRPSYIHNRINILAICYT